MVDREAWIEAVRRHQIDVANKRIYSFTDPDGDDLNVGWDLGEYEGRIFIETVHVAEDVSAVVTLAPAEARALAAALFAATSEQEGER